MKANTGKIHQVFVNILSNAIDSIADEGFVEINTKKDQKWLSVEFIDSGKGIPEEVLKKVTDPFFTTKAPGEGTGLGMSITQKIIHDHGGELKVTSKEDKGTTVTVQLPINHTS